MTKFITITTFLVLTLNACQAQTPEQQTEQDVVNRLEKWKDSPSFPTHQPNPELIKEFQDTGEFSNGLKEGKWSEYSLDTSRMGETDTIFFEEQDFGLTQSAEIIKEEGRYSHGQREGQWTFYELKNETPPFSWLKLRTVSYQNDQKHGEEIQYLHYGDPQKPLIVTNWEQGKERGIQKIYDVNYPNNLLKMYDVREDGIRIVKEYFPSGQLKIEFKDTALTIQEFVYVRQFSESGQLKQTGFYTPAGEPTGIWKTYDQNGKIESQKELTKK